MHQAKNYQYRYARTEDSIIPILLDCKSYEIIVVVGFFRGLIITSTYPQFRANPIRDLAAFKKYRGNIIRRKIHTLLMII